MTGQQRVVAAAVVAIGALAAAAAATAGWRMGAAALVGVFAGYALARSAFGFAAGWRRLVVERRGAGFRGQLLLVALATAVSLPVIAYGASFGVPAGGFVFPMGVPVAAGAFLFGVGMQFAGGCASGTLFTSGGGSVRMMLTLVFFIAGGVVATAHWDAWQTLPQLPPISLAGPLGPFGAIALTLAALGALAVAARRAELARHGSLAAPANLWGYGAGAVALAAVCVLTLVVLGRPWGITSGLTLWGAKVAHAVGVPIETWPYWTNAMAAVEASVLRDATSVMNFGIIAGATLSAGLAGRFRPSLRLSGRDVAMAVAGGLMMGYGARIAYGCNIGALLSGIASGSLHGWGWFVFAFLGTLAALPLRRAFGMDGAPAPAPVAA